MDMWTSGGENYLSDVFGLVIYHWIIMMHICNLPSFCLLHGVFVYILLLGGKDYINAGLNKLKFAVIWSVINHRIEFSVVA